MTTPTMKDIQDFSKALPQAQAFPSLPTDLFNLQQILLVLCALTQDLFNRYLGSQLLNPCHQRRCLIQVSLDLLTPHVLRSTRDLKSIFHNLELIVYGCPLPKG